MSSHTTSSSRTDDNLIHCLIAGGAGFIGSHLCQMLLDQNCAVYCVDNFSTGRKANIETLTKSPNFTFIEHDLNEQAPLKVDHQLDYIFHVAGIEAYTNGLDADMDTLLVNSFGAKTLLELAREHRAKFLLGSAEQIYGQNGLGVGFSNYFGDSRAQQGQQVFLEAKRFSEALTVEYAKEQQIDARIVRLAFLFGPKMNLHSGNMLAKILLGAVKDGVVGLPNDGMAVLYPTFITDAAYGLIKAMFSQSSKGKIYGLINPQPVTLLNLAYQIRDTLKRDIKINFYPNEKLPPNPIIAQEILKSQEALGWYPRENLNSGIKKTLDWLEGEGLVNTPRKELVTEIVNEPKPQKISAPEPVVKTTYQEKIKPLQVAPPIQSSSELVVKSEPVVTTVQPTVSKKGWLWEIKHKKIQASLSQVQNQDKHHVFKLSYLLIIFGILLLLGIGLGPRLGLAMLTSRGGAQTNLVQNLLKEENIEQAKSALAKSKQTLAQARSIQNLFTWQQDLFGVKLGDEVTTYLQYGSRANAILDSLLQVKSQTQNLAEIVFGDQTGDPKEALQQLQLNLSEANQNLSLLQADQALKEQNDNFSVQSLAMKDQVVAMNEMVSILPDLLAFDSKKTWLILLQDEHELRSTGGFIEGVALLTMDQGKLADFQTMDVYSLDQQLKGAVEPPTEIKDYLKEQAWWLRDSNINPNFPESAARAAWFVQKELGIKADGVMAVNLAFFQKYLAQSGELFLPEFDEKVSSGNIMERAQQHAEITLLDEDKNNTSKSFLVSLAKHSFERIKGQIGSFDDVVLSMHQALGENDLQIWLPDTNSASFMDEVGWDGSLRSTPTQLVEFGTIDLSDFLATFEANYGFNKTNYYMKRSIEHDVAINEKGQVQAETRLSLQNSSTTEAWPGGTYQVLVKTYIPADSKVSQVWVGDSVQNLKKIGSKQVAISSEGGKNLVTLFLKVLPQQTQIVQIDYQLSDGLPIGQESSNYALYVQKQSGITDLPITVHITYPDSLQVAKLSHKAQLSPGALDISLDTNKDAVVAVSFSP
ncbi:NAD-dependent epimerase/dehydratase family protein [Candidatus Beckwithbacteria bacterium]|nr:NAD-dependent epimerase/dehydratase family protein [Candidatus Beckwithbacteria bacterium]